MTKQNVFVVVAKDIQATLQWAMRELDKHLAPKYLDDLKHVKTLLKEGRGCNLIIVDYFIKNQPTLEDIKEIKANYPNIKVLLVLSASHPAGDVHNIVKTKLFAGIVLRPFSAEQLLEQIYKVCAIQKPQDTPWYMKAGLQK